MFGPIARRVAFLIALVSGQILALALVSPAAQADATPSEWGRVSFGAEVNDKAVSVGETVYDNIYVSNMPSAARPTLKWRLLGPLKPQGGSCKALRWGAARVASRGSFNVEGDILVATEPVTVREPGCYSYVVTLTEIGTSRRLVRSAGTSPQTVRVLPAS